MISQFHSSTNRELSNRAIVQSNRSSTEVGAKKFLSIISKEPFNYTEWQKDLFNGLNIEQLSSAAMRYRIENDKLHKD
jgi:hypothetical protein